VHHWDDPAAAVPELTRVLRPGGRVVVYDFPSSPLDRLGAGERTPFRTGVMFLRCVRYIMSA
jgi:ubiquinone/menaquinone biosynthesis C-methylase UbiE